MLYRLFKVIALSVAVSACQSLPPFMGGTGPEPVNAPHEPTTQSEVVVGTDTESDYSEPTVAEVVVPEPDADLWARIQRQLSLPTDHPRVVEARQRYLREQRYMAIVTERASPYLYYIVEQVEARGMPIEIALLPMVESAFNPFALSGDNAAGLWQIMPRTGTQLGLAQNWWYDGRLDLRDSTDAALDYLEEMQQSLDGDWLLALAAYNSGKGRVLRARKKNDRKGKGTDYWSIDLPRETEHYIPRLLAIASILARPDHYGVALAEVPNAPYFEAVSTGGQIELARAAKLADLSHLELLKLNPGHLRWATAPEQAGELLVPSDKAPRLVAGIAELPADQRVTWQHYRIRSGDNLIGIARRFDTQVDTLRAVNNIRGSFIRAGETLLIPNSTEYTASLALAGVRKSRKMGYQVRRGDSLYRIAGRFKVSVNDIVQWNSLDPTAYLQPGQKLTIYPRGG